MDAFYRFNADDGWAIASHIALSGADVAVPVPDPGGGAGRRIFGTVELANEVAQILLEAWPTQVATPLAKEVQNVLGTARGDVLTIGVLLAIFFASSGIESLRIGLNRAYGVDRDAELVADAAGIDRLRARRARSRCWRWRSWWCWRR